jgi:hypothetical protein
MSRVNFETVTVPHLSQTFPKFYGNKLHKGAQKGSPLVPVVGQVNPLQVTVLLL